MTLSYKFFSILSTLILFLSGGIQGDTSQVHRNYDEFDKVWFYCSRNIEKRNLDSSEFVEAFITDTAGAKPRFSMFFLRHGQHRKLGSIKMGEMCKFLIDNDTSTLKIPIKDSISCIQKTNGEFIEDFEVEFNEETFERLSLSTQIRLKLGQFKHEFSSDDIAAFRLVLAAWREDRKQK
jgi:hypothetical protein